MIKLNHNFMAELFKLVFIDETIARIVFGHLTYQHIPKEWIGYKFIFKEVIEQYNKKDVNPSLGVIAQKFTTNLEVLETIDEIKEARLVDRDLIIDQLEAFIKETEFELLSKKVHDLYEEGKRDEAIRINAEESKRINDTSLRGTGGNFVEVFGGFEERIKKKRTEQLTAKTAKKVAFGIDKLDDLSYGGADPGDIILWIARSGVGKSIALRWHGYCAAIEGESVLHIQLEGGIDACLNKYDQMWTNQPFMDIKNGNIKEEDKVKIKKVLNEMRSFGKDINVYGFKRFGEASVSDVRNLCIEYQKIKGYFPRLVIVDSLDLLKTGINKKLDYDPEFKKEKLQKCAQLLKDLAVETNCVVTAATQTSDVPIEVWNNEDKVIDRSYTEGDKTLVKPFSFVFTCNITMQEKKEGKCRIYVDKLRDYKDAQQTFSIATDYDRGRFYHKGRTVALYSQLSKQAPEEKKEKLTKGNKKTNCTVI